MTSTIRNSLGLRLSLSILVIASLALVLLIVSMGVFMYQAEIALIEHDARSIRSATVPGLVEGIWGYDEKRVLGLAESLHTHRHLVYVSLRADGLDIEYGDQDRGQLIHSYDLQHALGGNLGRLVVHFDRDSVLRSVQDRVIPILGFAMIPIGAMALATLVLFRRMITQPLESLSRQAGSITFDTLDRDFGLGERFGDTGDELGQLVASIDRMRRNLHREIWERQTAERKLDETEQKYRDVFNATGEAIFVHDAETGRIVEVNETMLEMYGYTQDETDGLTVDQLTVRSDEHTAEAARRLIALAAQGHPQLFEWRARRKDGSGFWVEVSLKRLGSVSANRLLAVVRDVTARKEFEERQLQTQKMETLGQLAGGIAHDVNNILAGVLATVEQIPNLEPGEEVDETVATIRKTCKQGADLTGKLLAFSRDRQVDLQPVDLVRIARDTVDILGHGLDKQIRLELDLSREPCWVVGDAGQLQNVILNLALNARDAMPSGGALKIACRAAAGAGDDGPQVMLAVEDEGVGMDPDTLAKAFEPFFTTKPIGAGTGLGLASAYGTIKDHGGTVDITSRPGRGTRVTILLPAGEEPRDDAEREPAAAAVRPARMLVIEDEELLRDMTTRTLEREGHQVVAACDGIEGIEKYRTDETGFDLVIVDMMMPRMSGDAVFRLIRDMDSEARILLTTGFTDAEVINQLLEAGLAGVVAKPASREEFLRAVEAALS